MDGPETLQLIYFTGPTSIRQQHATSACISSFIEREPMFYRLRVLSSAKIIDTSSVVGRRNSTFSDVEKALTSFSWGLYYCTDSILWCMHKIWRRCYSSVCMPTTITTSPLRAIYPARQAVYQNAVLALLETSSTEGGTGNNLRISHLHFLFLRSSKPDKGRGRRSKLFHLIGVKGTPMHFPSFNSTATSTLAALLRYTRIPLSRSIFSSCTSRQWSCKAIFTAFDWPRFYFNQRYLCVYITTLSKWIDTDGTIQRRERSSVSHQRDNLLSRKFLRLHHCCSSLSKLCQGGFGLKKSWEQDGDNFFFHFPAGEASYSEPLQ